MQEYLLREELCVVGRSYHHLHAQVGKQRHGAEEGGVWRKHCLAAGLAGSQRGRDTAKDAALHTGHAGAIHVSFSLLPGH